MLIDSALKREANKGFHFVLMSKRMGAPLKSQPSPLLMEG